VACGCGPSAVAATGPGVAARCPFVKDTGSLDISF
jgi:hypothetical protein